jgi:hypothetical protein
MRARLFVIRKSDGGFVALYGGSLLRSVFLFLPFSPQRTLRLSVFINERVDYRALRWSRASMHGIYMKKRIARKFAIASE